MGEQVSSKPGLLRMFVAVQIPDSIKKEIEIVQRKLRKLDLFAGTYVEPAHAHLTLKFIGYVEPLALPPVKELLKSVYFRPITVKSGRLGCFESRGSIKVIWLGLKGEGLVELAESIDGALSLKRTPKDKEFHAHVTVARVKTCSDIKKLRNELEAIDVPEQNFTVDKFDLMQSTLTPEGPVYVCLESYEGR